VRISPAFAQNVRDEFLSWVQCFDERDNGYFEFDRLQHYVVHWLIYDDGVLVTGGDYASYLLAVLVLQYEYAKDPGLLVYRPESADLRRGRPVSAVIDLDDVSASYFDRHRYQQEVFRQTLGRRPR
jgi:hypothetical protein